MNAKESPPMSGMTASARGATNRMTKEARMAGYTWENTPIEVGDEALGGARATEAGAFTLAFERWKASSDTTPLLKGLPGDSCQAPHWGYLTKGQFRVVGANGDEVIHAGEAYYLAPGHNVIVEQDVEIIEFTPTDDRNATMEHIAKAIGELAQGSIDS